MKRKGELESACEGFAEWGLAVFLRKSTRARNLALRMLPGRGLEVVLPRGASERDAAALLLARRGWIKRTAERMTGRGADLSGCPVDLPAQVELRAIGRKLSVGYTPRSGSLRLRENAGRLLLSGPVGERELIFQKLREYVRKQAKAYLPFRLREMSREFGLAFDEVHVRCQRTRWGSCSQRGIGRSTQTRISLNAKLLFLRPPLCEQVLLHELCHLLHPDHSPAYWAAVERYNPRGRELERELGHGYQLVPSWWEASF